MPVGFPWSKLRAVGGCSKGATSSSADWKNMDRGKMPSPVAAFYLQHQCQNILELQYDTGRGGFKGLHLTGVSRIAADGASRAPRVHSVRGVGSGGADPTHLCVHVCKAVLYYL